MSPCWIAVTGRQKLYVYFESQHPTNVSDSVTAACAKNRDDRAEVAVRSWSIATSKVPVDLQHRVDRAIEKPDFLLFGAARVRKR